MTVEVRVYSDYVCPYCFLAEFPLKDAIVRTAVRVEGMPFELAPEPHAFQEMGIRSVPTFVIGKH